MELVICVVLSEVLLALDVYLSNVRAVSGLTVPPRFSRNLTMQCVVLSEVLLALDVYLSNVRAVSGLTVPPRHFDPNHSVFKPIAHVITADLPTYSFNPFYLL
ncbi:hypothetical protein TrispH2_002427 [Trichoplax sp. H2]|nr:hypothetical protein TrispH2_002427 [Trichoplax sp. H2]|eukprot:RDD44848.1 hypothetical protein TrispH2_002427 [Trichoplax sp. H2]